MLKGPLMTSIEIETDNSQHPPFPHVFLAIISDPNSSPPLHLLSSSSPDSTHLLSPQRPHWSPLMNGPVFR